MPQVVPFGKFRVDDEVFLEDLNRNCWRLCRLLAMVSTVKLQLLELGRS